MADTDREMLELAAKAAGMSGTCVDYDDRLVFLEDGKPASVEWNPLTDDGDALRLAVKLGLHINAAAHSSSVNGVYWFAQAGVRDVHAATRRAITRAAAELARAQGEKQ